MRLVASSFGVTALGLIAFGLYGIAEGVYRQVDAPNLREAAVKAD